MHTWSFKVSGTKDSLEGLREALLAEPETAKMIVTDLTPESDTDIPGPIRVRQIEVADAIFAFAIEIPAGVTAHLVYDWLREWLKRRADAAQARVQEITPSSVPEDEKTRKSD